MKATNRVSWGATLRQASVAGIAGGIILEVYLWLTTMLPAHTSIVAALQFVASTLVGKVAFTSTAYAAFGLIVHFAVSVGWAGGYAYFAAMQPATNRHWPVAGAAYGIVVYTLMQLILLAGGNFHGPATPNAFVNLVVAHTVFFGIPIAYAVHAVQPA